MAGRRGKVDAAAQEVELASGVLTEAASIVEAGGLKSEADGHLRSACSEIGGEHVRVIGNVGAVDPAARD